jgi:hypothetical protein
MSTAKRITVISEAGHLVGTQVVSDVRSDSKGPAAWIVAGPGQILQEIEIEAPEAFSNPEEVKAFHDRIRRATSLK